MAIGPKKIKKVKTSPKVVSTNAVVSNVATLNLGNENQKSKSNFKQKTFITDDLSGSKLKLKNKSGVGLFGNRDVTKTVYKGVVKNPDGTYSLLKNRTVNGRNKSKEKEISEKKYKRIKKRMSRRGDNQFKKYNK